VAARAPGPPPGRAPIDSLIEAAPEVGVRGTFRRFWPLTRPYRKWLVVMSLFTATSPILDGAGIWLFKLLVDDVLTPRNFDAFGRVAVLYVVVAVASGAISFASGYLSTWVGERFVTDLRGAVYEHLHSLSMDFFERRRLGDLLNRLGGDVAAIESVVLFGIPTLLSLVLKIVIYAGALFYLDWRLATVSLTVAPLLWLVSRYFARVLKDASRENRRRSAAMTALAEESLANAALVQAYNRQAGEIEKYQAQALEAMRSQLRSSRLRGIFTPITDVIELAGLLMVVGYGAWQLTTGRLTMGELLVFMAFFARLYSPIRGIGKFATSMSSATASAERIIEVTDTEPIVQPAAVPVVLARARGALALNAVTFSYPGQAKRSLRAVRLAVEPGQTVALVGASGSGKSTICKLLLRFYDPDDGSVTLDGTDLRRLDVHSVRENISIVMQETLVFDGTIRDNILWGRPGATDAQFDAAVAASDVARFVADLPDGLDTRVGQRGRRLSGGQRQRVAIARAMLRDTPILVLDEPTTGLDAAAAQRILRPLRTLASGRTTISVSHDLLTTQFADLIVVLDRGRVVESGTHPALLAADGAYAALFRLHRGGPDTPVVPLLRAPRPAWDRGPGAVRGGRPVTLDSSFAPWWETA
jgi:ATP-binding cassette subfamily B protein